MDLLKAEIARKKKQLQQTNVMAPNKTYFKRKDLEEKQTEAYWKRQKKKMKDDEYGDEGETSSDQKSTTQGGKFHLPRKEVIRRLREREEPILLFGESEEDAFQRLKRLEILQPEIIKGFKNDFKAAMDQVEEQYQQDLLRSSGTDSDKVTGDVKVKDATLSIEEILKKGEGLGTGDNGLDCDVILNFLKLVLKEWGEELNSRPQEDKRSSRGRLDSATHMQTVTYIKPLFRRLKHKDISPDILACLVDIVKYLLDRNYLRANDAYVEMAIGNAPWPIGVTMVGIHARTGREKIFAKNVAHVLNDETQRKYIQALKRIMTQCQKFFPTDPSRSVNYESHIH